MTELFKKIYYFFPVNLLSLHFKKNQVLLAFWAFFFAAVSGNIGRELGLHYLFLDPEYLGRANFMSFFIVGICMGVFIVAYFISSYIMEGHRYKFIVLMKYPFITFSINNCLLPLVFLVFYMFRIYLFQSNQGLESFSKIFFQLIGLLMGTCSILTLVIFYFSKTNRSALQDISQNINKSLMQRRNYSKRSVEKILASRESKYKIVSYFSSSFKYAKVPKNIEIDKNQINKVFDQNHLNAVFLELILFLVIMSLGFYKDFSFFQIPAGASSFLFFSFALMFVGALFYWLRAWALTVMVLGFIAINMIMKTGKISSKYEAFGLNYQTVDTKYSREILKSLNSDENINNDKLNTINILNNWRAKFGEKKPKLVIVTASGGGQRSALWTTCVLRALDKKLDKKLMKNTTLMTGASGGVIGSSYYRELYLRDLLGELNLFDAKHVENISKDILNPMVFSLLVNDLIFRYQTFDFKGKTYSAGRGYAFENTLNSNLGGILGRSIGEYKDYEFSGVIPMVVLAPTITNDSRKLFISTQKVSYFNQRFSQKSNNFRDRGVDFLTLFANQDAQDLRFLSALRMSATFPYITPNVHLPSDPDLEIMDAGLSDNFGTSDALKYLNVFKDWINENTSGVVVIGIRDKEKNPEVANKDYQSILDKLLNPIDALYSNWDFVQDNSYDQLYEILSNQFTIPIDQVLFEYIPPVGQGEKASLSWHLTHKEKESIKNNIHKAHNKNAIERVVKLLQ